MKSLKSKLAELLPQSAVMPRVQQFPVRCITIDSESLSHVGFIKLDVEQHERKSCAADLKQLTDVGPRCWSKSIHSSTSTRCLKNSLSFFEEITVHGSPLPGGGAP